VVEATVAAAALLLSLPLLAGVAAGVWLTLGRPILFRQLRAGYRGWPFLLLKFRTMRHAPGEPDETRLTRFGRVVRRLSLDELPQLWNVVRGEMALVGPRPLPLAYLPRYSPVQARRHEVPPGITGLAQVSGRNALGWPERLALDVWYVDHRSIGLDCRILVRTLRVVLRRDGISARGHATMPDFMGEQECLSS
jgi:lipopolysaccharide/colanic/teichoic acid biosynthesis glycosyltransferase